MLFISWHLNSSALIVVIYISMLRSLTIYVKVSYIGQLDNGPYSLLNSACYIYFSSMHVRFAFAIFTVCKWRWWHRMFLLSRVSAKLGNSVA